MALNRFRHERRGWLWSIRAVIVIAGLAFGVFRWGVDRLDRRLAAVCWNVPSLWNAVAEAAAKTGVIDSTILGSEVLLRRASVHSFFQVRYAIVAQSDLFRTDIYVINEAYDVVGRFRRQTTQSQLITDRRRGLSPLSHLLPVYDSRGTGRLSTLIGFSPLESKNRARGKYAYVSLGPVVNEIQMVCDIRTSPHWSEVTIVVDDVTDDGLDDIAIYALTEIGEKSAIDPRPIAAFHWDDETSCFVPDVPAEIATFLSYWCATPDSRFLHTPDEWLDEAQIDALPLMRSIERDRR